MHTTNKTFGFIAILLTIYWSFSDMKPSYSLQETTDPTSFSLKNALNHLKNITQKPHPVGTKEHKKVQTYLLEELKKLGLKPEIQIETVFNSKWKAGTTVENIVTKIKGKSSNKTLVVASHYDSNPHSSIGASDAGSGIVTILEGIRAYLAKNITPKNDIIILFTDAEELGLLGAEAFVKHHPWAQNIGLVLNFEARGSGGPSYMLMETNGKNSKLLRGFLEANPKYPAANSLMYSVYKMLPNDTDLTVFREKANTNGFNFAFIGDHFDYHTAQDSFERLDIASLAHQKEYFETSLAYFSEADLSQLHSEKDDVFVNFPFIGLLTFPFSWIIPLIGIALAIFFVLIGIGLRNKSIHLNEISWGAIPFLVSLISCGVGSYFLWRLILLIHPAYNDILHGFPYNGYFYITAFSLLNIWIVFKIYSRFNTMKIASAYVFPILFWLGVNILLYTYLKGGAFFLIPLFLGLISLGILVLKKKSAKYNLLVIFTVPTLYIFAPLIKMFPVGLGLKNVFISAIFIVLVSGIILPIWYQKNKKAPWTKTIGLATILFFGIATFYSGFSIDRKKPNSLVYTQDLDSKTAFWGTYNATFDSYIEQVFHSDYSEGSIQNAETMNKYNRRFKFLKKATFKDLKAATILTDFDTIIDEEREIWFTIKPQRNVQKFEFFAPEKILLSHVNVNSVTLQDTLQSTNRRTLFSYYMGNTDTELCLKIRFPKQEKPTIILNEISNDLLTHPEFSLYNRDQTMMPMPFVTNDAIISSRKLPL